MRQTTLRQSDDSGAIISPKFSGITLSTKKTNFVAFLSTFGSFYKHLNKFIRGRTQLVRHRCTAAVNFSFIFVQMLFRRPYESGFDGIWQGGPSGGQGTERQS
jgi:hypothetical protein